MSDDDNCPTTNEEYKKAVKDYEYASDERKLAQQREYDHWKKVLELENKYFGSKHNV